MSEAATLSSLSDALVESAAAIEDVLDSVLPLPEGPEARLFEAMRYAALGSGKRLRPFLVLCGARLAGAPEARALRVGAAIELVHCYSLIHDDLPAMDDSDMRRGKPSCHVAFDEATAILAGDALLTLAFEVLADPATHPDARVRGALLEALAVAAGPRGMVGGQMIDLEAEHSAFDVSAITRMQRLKTGALFRFACTAGAILGEAPEPVIHALELYAHDLGLAFQIADDLLDAEGCEADTGKSVGKDAAAGKATFVSLLGIEAARERARLLSRQAAGHLEMFDQRATHLRDIAAFVVERRA